MYTPCSVCEQRTDDKVLANLAKLGNDRRCTLRVLVPGQAWTSGRQRVVADHTFGGDVWDSVPAIPGAVVARLHTPLPVR